MNCSTIADILKVISELRAKGYSIELNTNTHLANELKIQGELVAYHRYIATRYPIQHLSNNQTQIQTGANQ